MSREIYITYPQPRWVSPIQIESWYAEAVEAGMIPKDKLDAKHWADMATALACVGIIVIGEPS